MVNLFGEYHMRYEEFIKYKEYNDPENHLVHAYEDEEGNRFYVEPGFYDGLLGFKEKRAERFDEIMEEINDFLAAKAEEMAPDESQFVTEE